VRCSLGQEARGIKARADPECFPAVNRALDAAPDPWPGRALRRSSSGIGGGGGGGRSASRGPAVLSDPGASRATRLHRIDVNGHKTGSHPSRP